MLILFGVSTLVHCIHLLVLVSSKLELDTGILWIMRRNGACLYYIRQDNGADLQFLYPLPLLKMQQFGSIPVLTLFSWPLFMLVRPGVCSHSLNLFSHYIEK